MTLRILAVVTTTAGILLAAGSLKEEDVINGPVGIFLLKFPLIGSRGKVQ